MNAMLRLTALTLCVALKSAFCATAQDTTYISSNASWKYLDNGSNQNTAWRSLNFVDSTWANGNAELGYGDGDETTVVSYGGNASSKYTTTYFRKRIYISDTSLFRSFYLQLIRDDGAVVYANDSEIVRNNMPTGTVAYNTFASSAIGGTDESTWYNYSINTRYFKTGWNIISIEIHQSDLTSSDISFNLILSGVRKPATGLSFNGSNQYVTFGTALGLGCNQFTLETWIKRTGTGATTTTGTGGIANIIPLISKGRGESDGSNLDMNYILGIRSSDSVLCADFEEGTGQASPGLNHPTIGVTSLQRNVWYHVAVTYDGQKWKLYLNGNLDKTDSVGRLPQSLSIQHAGLATAMTSTGATQGFFAGIMDEVRIWSYARTQSQIQSAINTEVTDTTGLRGYWRLNDSTGTIARSNGSSGINGTLTNGPAWVAGSPFNLTITGPNNPPATPTAITPADSSINRNNNTLSITATDPENHALTVTFYGRLRPAVADSPNFTIIPLPDTQFYCEQSNGGSNAMFKTQTNWVVNNKNTRNIKYLVQLGDCVQNGDNGGNDIEWKRADTSMSILENPSTTQLTYGLPYGVNVGNHDQSPGGSAVGTTIFYNQYFGSARFSGRPYYGGHYGSNNDNHFQLFSASGMDFISINMEYDTNADTLVINWADSLLKAYPLRRGIVNSHWIINSDASWGAQGQAIYNKLKSNSNLHLMLCGHINPNGEARRTDTYNGNTVHTLLSDFQDRTNGGNGWMRIMEFRPGENKIYVYTYSPTLNQFETDANSQFVLDYNMSGGFTNLGSVTVNSGSAASINWPGLLNNSQYEWYVTISDSVNTTTSNVFRFTHNPAPVVTSPNGGETWQAGSIHNITWTANGSQTLKLEYSTNGSSWNTIANATPAAPGLYTWTTPTAPSANYRIRITDTTYITAFDTSNSVFTIASDTLIPAGSNWKYLDNGSNQGITWRDSSFNDASWASANAEFGYGDGDEVTLVNACGTVTQNPSCTNKYTTTYFRKKIYIPNLNDFLNFQLGVVRDDGVVVYVNGNEVWRDNLPTGTIAYNTLAPVAIGGADEAAWQTSTLAKTYFVNGWNTISVEMHQQSGTSSDVSFNLRLKGNQAPNVPVLVLAPNGGENWTAGSTKNITWQAQTSVSKVKIEFSTNGSSWTVVNSSVNAASGTYSWSVPFTFSSTCMIRISDTANTAAFDTSDARFTISNPPPATLLRGPYLQMANSNAITLRWRTDVAVTSRVRWGTTAGNLTSFKDDSNAVTEHELRLTGLSPYTKYYYSIGSLADTLQGDTANYFRTAPVTGETGRYLISAIGDCGNASTNQINVKNQLINYLGNNYLNAWILLGDNAYSNGTDAEFQAEFFNIYRNDLLKKYPLFPAPGNHDYDNGSATAQNTHAVPYYNMFTMPTAAECGGTASGTEAFYSFDYGNIHFLSLDSYGKENSATRLYDTTGAQVQWIKNDLAANTNKQWVVAYWHHPPYTMGSHNSDSEGELASIRTNFIKILERYGVDLILCGHSHDYERSKLMKGHYGAENTFVASTHHLSTSSGKYNGTSNSCPYVKDSLVNAGTVYVVSGSAGQLGGTQTSFPYDAMFYSDATNGGSLLMDVQGNRMDVKWICADGAVRDQFTMVKDVNQKKNYTIDLGDTLQLTASFNGTYNWTPVSGSTKSLQVIPDTSKSYVVKDQYSCISDTFNVSVTFPTITSNALATLTAICSGNTLTIPFSTTGKFFSGNVFKIQLSDSTGSFANPTIIGSITSTHSDTIIATIPSSTLSGTAYRIRIISSIPSVTTLLTSTAFVINKNLPSVTFASNKTANTLCMGDSVTFTASGASAYQFFINGTSQGSATVTNTFITSSLSNGQVVKVKGFNACGADSASLTMTVKGIPSVVLTSNDSDNTICLNSNIAFTATGATTYQFFINGTSQGSASTTNTFNTSTLAVGTQKIKVTGSNGCFAKSDSINVTVIGVPSVVLTSNDSDNTICQNSNIAFISTGATTYQFFVNGTSQGAASTSNTFTTSSLAFGTQKVKVTGSNGCFAKSDSINVTVIGVPNIVLSSNDADNTICQNSNIAFTSNGAITYQFFINGTSQGAASITNTFNTSALAVGTQKVKVTGANSCFSKSDSISVMVIGLPNVSISSNDADNSICQNSNIAFTSTGATTYQFFVNGTSQGAASTTNTFNTSTLAVGIQKVKVTGNNACFAKDDSLNITVTGVPNVTLASNDADNTICQGTSLIFTASGATTYQFFVNGMPQGAAGTVNIFTSLTPTNGQTIRAIGNNGCFTKSDSIRVTVIGIPAIILGSNDSDNTICQNTPVSFNASGGTTYQFFINGTAQGGPSANTIFNTPALTNGLQVIKVKGDNSCFSAFDSVTMTVNPLPMALLNCNDGDYTICAGNPVIIQALGASRYEFFVDGVSQGPESFNALLSLSPSVSKKISVKAVSPAGCVALSQEINLTVHPPLNVSMAKPDSIYHINDPLVLLTGIPAGGIFSGPGISGNKFDPTKAGLGGPYLLTYSYTNPLTGCSGSDSTHIMVEVYTSAPTLLNPDVLRIYPNPAEDMLYVDLNLKTAAQVEVSMHDVNGKNLLHYPKTNKPAGKEKIEINRKALQLASGTYWIKVLINDEENITKVIFK